MEVETHGGSCCGMRHIHEMNEDVRGRTNGRDSAKKLLRLFTTNDNNVAQNTYNTEIILSDLQTREMPDLLAEMARLGYVYTTSWRGNHRTPVHLFHRAARRLRLEDAGFYQTWVNEHRGMVASSSLGGELPSLNVEEAPPPVVNRGRNRGDHEAEVQRNVGRRATVNSPASRFNGRTGEITGWTGNFWDGYRYNILIGAETARISQLNVTIVQDEQQQQERWPLGDRTYRHTNTPEQRPQAPQQRAPTVTVTQYFAAFQNGRSSGPYESIDALREANPRCMNYRAQRIYSNGTVEMGERTRIAR